MSKELNATCAICGKKYNVCNTCKNTKVLKPWRTVTDTIDCYKIYMIVHDFTNDIITKEDARKKLETVTLPDTLQDHIKSSINKIIGSEKKNKPETRKGTTDNNLGNNE